MWLYPESVEKNGPKLKLCLTPEIKLKYFRIGECVGMGQTTVCLLFLTFLEPLIHDSKYGDKRQSNSQLEQACKTYSTESSSALIEFDSN